MKKTSYTLYFIFIFWSAFEIYAYSKKSSWSFQRSQELNFGLVDWNSYQNFIMGYNILCILIAVTAFFLLWYFKETGKHSKLRRTFLSLSSIIFLLAKPIVLGLFLKMNSLASAVEPKRVTCTVLTKHFVVERVSYTNCSQALVESGWASSLLSSEQFNRIDKGSVVQLLVHPGLWKNWVSETELIAD